MQQVNVVHDLVWFWVTKRERCQTQCKQTHPRLTPLRRVLPHCSLHGPVPRERGSSPPNAGPGQASLRQVSAALLTRERRASPSGTLPPGLAALHAPTCPFSAPRCSLLTPPPQSPSSLPTSWHVQLCGDHPSPGAPSTFPSCGLRPPRQVQAHHHGLYSCQAGHLTPPLTGAPGTSRPDLLFTSLGPLSEDPSVVDHDLCSHHPTSFGPTALLLLLPNPPAGLASRGQALS